MNPAQNKAAMQDHIPQWQASNLTQAEHCKAHDIKPHIFSYYKKKFSSTTNNLEPFDYLKYLLTELPKLGRHYDKEALDQFPPWNLIEKIKPLK